MAQFVRLECTLNGEKIHTINSNVRKYISKKYGRNFRIALRLNLEEEIWQSEDLGLKFPLHNHN
jgi:hypothetical protein